MLKSRILVLAIHIFVVYSGFTQPFITTWKTDKPGVSSPTSITIPTAGGGYNYDVDWDNDGTYDQFGITGSATHDYLVAGTYTIRIQGAFPGINFNNGGDKQKILAIEQWGGISWANMANAFWGAKNLTSNASDSPDLSGVTNMANMFIGANAFNGDLSGWDVSTVTNMINMFLDATSFNGDISTWNVSNVNYMSDMFHLASAFNGDLSAWDVSNVEDMMYMFKGATAFNGDISAWDVGQVLNMSNMFEKARSFNANISAWDVANVAGLQFMFFEANAFNQNLKDWDIGSATSMSLMLSYSGLSAANYDSTLIGWESQGVSNLSLGALGRIYCEGDSARNSLINTYGWTISGDILACFPVSSAFVSTWNTNNPGTSDSSSITIPTLGGNGYNYDVDWNNDGTFDEFGITGEITHDFGVAGTYTIGIQGIFAGIYFNNGGDKQKIVAIEQWGTIVWNRMSKAFYGAINLTSNAIDTPFLAAVTDMSFMFYGAASFNGDISGWDVSNVINMSSMFTNASTFNQDLGNWDVANVTNMRGMFQSATPFNANLSNWNVSKVTNMSFMFFGANNFNSNLSAWDVAQVTNMSYMFYLASTFDGNISTWNVGKVTTMSNMFNRASNFNQDLSSWNVAMVSDMRSMFQMASVFNSNLNSWNVAKVINMSNMFNRASDFSGDIRSWDVSKVTNMSLMFAIALNFDQNLGGWIVSKVNNMQFMFSGTELSLPNYDSLLIGWSTQSLFSNVQFHAGSSVYCADSARQSIIDSFNWTILDGGLSPNCGPPTTTYTSGSWDNGAPDSNTEVIFADNYDTQLDGGSIEAYSVIVNPNIQVIINSNDSLNVSNDILIKGIITVKLLGHVTTNY